MSILIFEDNNEKYQDIQSALLDRGVSPHQCRRVRSTSEFAALANSEIDLCIIDVMMPNIDGGTIRDAGLEVLTMLSFAGKTKVPVLAISAFAEELRSQADRYSERGCIIFDYHKRESWLAALDVYLAQARDQGRYRFIIFASLRAERDAFLNFSDLGISSTIRYGIDHWDVSIGDAYGTIVLLPRVGIVSAAATVSKVLDRYTPEIAAMCGICAGIGDDTELGQLLVVDVCWEYQSGKWLEDAFLAEPYQVSINAKTRARLAKLLENERLLHELESGYEGRCRPSTMAEPKFSVFATGSAVIASATRLDHVKQQHRKVSGLDMEVFGFHHAAELANESLHAFSVKAVVDKADTKKGDELHEYGSYISAKFILNAISDMLKEDHSTS